MNSKILSGNSKNFRFFLIDSTNVVKDMIKHNNIDDIFAYDLSKLLSVVYLVRENTKVDYAKISIKVLADGLFGNITSMATKNNSAILKLKLDDEKIIKYNKSLLENNFDEYKKIFSIGNGKLQINVDYGLKNIYTSTINIKDGNIDKAIYDYYKSSEQVDSIIFTSNTFENDKFISSGAIIIQTLPNTDISLFEKLKEKFKRIYSISHLLSKSFKLEDIISLIFEDDEFMFENNLEQKTYIDDYKINYVKDIFYECNCSLEKMIELLKTSVSKEEILEFLEKDKKIELQCNLCDKKYTIHSIDELYK